MKTKSPAISPALQRIMRVRNPANLDVFYETVLGDVKTGKVLDRQADRCHSFVANFLRQMLMTWAGCTNTSMTDMAAITPTNLSSYFYGAAAGVSDDTFGPLVGTGTNAATINDTALQTKIAHGTTAGKLQYSATSFGTPTTDSTSAYFIMTRVFTNASGSTITVNEIGIASSLYSQDEATQRYFLCIRDVIAARAILNGQFLTTNYVFKAIA